MIATPEANPIQPSRQGQSALSSLRAMNIARSDRCSPRRFLLYMQRCRCRQSRRFGRSHQSVEPHLPFRARSCPAMLRESLPREGCRFRSTFLTRYLRKEPRSAQLPCGGRGQCLRQRCLRRNRGAILTHCHPVDTPDCQLLSVDWISFVLE